MNERLRQQVRSRAGDCCEYCRVPQASDSLPFQADHIIAEFHHGLTESENLAWSCFDCNVYKGTNLAGFDAVSQAVVPLFHPRRDDWNVHFAWQGPVLAGKTDRGRATVDVLRINLPSRVEHRRLLIQLGEMSGSQLRCSGKRLQGLTKRHALQLGNFTCVFIAAAAQADDDHLVF